MTGRSARAWTGARLARIAQLALQAGDGLNADEVDAPDLTAILRELQEDIGVPGGLLPMLAQVVSTAARRGGASSRTATATPPAPCTRPPHCSPTTPDSA
ncbi:hypothetical protein ACF1G0_29940 [Streptomyces sp. NPDC013953]|uniref:hypothetical protein n=1 Tax=Streptomyces sp. NPDC013953 TaxID=3364868 RepID=UPI0036FA135C